MAGLKDLRERVVLVTGASSGIGEALARELWRRGAKLALVARRAERLAALAEELARGGHPALALPCDVRDPGAVDAAARAVEERWGGVDLLVNNAGQARHALFAEQTTAEIEDIMRTNYMGAVHWIHRLLPGMRARRQGWIVNVSSFAGKLGQADEAAYSASKFALTGLSQALAQELRPLGLHVLCVHPTLVRTEMFTPEVLARMPVSSARSFIDADDFAQRALRALARGRTEVVIPGRMKAPLLMHALLPEWMGRTVGRMKLAALRRAGIRVD